MGSFSLADLSYMFFNGLKNGSIGTIGAKGDPGGFNSGTELGAVNLVSVTTPGLYKQSASSNVTLANEYPANLTLSPEKRCTIEVIQWGGTGYVTQILRPISQVAGQGGVIYQRSTRNGTTFERWQIFSSTRTDETAGRAIYQWDELNNREQLIYGNTGWRDVKSLIPEYVSGIIKVRRRDNYIEFIFESAIFTEMASGTKILLPFMGNSENLMNFGVGGYNTANSHFFQSGWSGNHFLLLGGNPNVSGFISFPTRSPWPTTLPGTASGSIPYS